MASYRYLRDIDPEELKPDAPHDYSQKEKAANWWHYHWKTLAVVLAVCALALWFLSDLFSAGPEPDYCITLVSPDMAPDEVCAALETALTPYAQDRNGDGRTVVEVRSITMEFSEFSDEESGGSDAASMGGDVTRMYNSMAGATRLSADFENNESYLFLLYDPAGFARYTQSLTYLDGTLQEEIDSEDREALMAIDWQNMVYRWEDCPVLAGLELGGYTPALSDETYSCQEYLARFYVARRGCWNEKALQAFEGGDLLWETLTAGAVSTAGDGQ